MDAPRMAGVMTSSLHSRSFLPLPPEPLSWAVEKLSGLDPSVASDASDARLSSSSLSSPLDARASLACLVKLAPPSSHLVSPEVLHTLDVQVQEYSGE